MFANCWVCEKDGERRYDTYEAALEDGIYESLQMIPDIV
jgi:hypothetical protein